MDTMNKANANYIPISGVVFVTLGKQICIKFFDLNKILFKE